MAVVLHEINAASDAGAFQLDVSVDGQHSAFGATLSAHDSAGGCDDELFYLLSERGLAERGSSAQYHMDLVLLLQDMQRGKAVKLPFVFGVDRRFPTGSTYERRSWWQRVAFWRLVV